MAHNDPENDVANDRDVDNVADLVTIGELAGKIQKLETLLHEIARDLGYLE